jgi:hypothetical protein
LFTFGRGDRGQLGHGTNENVFSPKIVDFFIEQHVKLISAGFAHTVVVTAHGEIYSFGLNENGQLGLGHQRNENIPKRVESEYFFGQKVSGIACGAYHTLAIIGVEGKVFTWGKNDKGQCGLNDGVTPKEFAVLTPHEIVSFKNTKIRQVAAGSEHSAAVDDLGYLYTWGNGDVGQLGIDVVEDFMESNSDVSLKPTIQKSSPQRVKEALLNERVVKVACGSFHTLVLTDQGEMYSFGLGDQGQLGQVAKTKSYTPGLVRGDHQNIPPASDTSAPQTKPKRIFLIAAGGRHCLAATGYIPIFVASDSTYSKDFQKLVNSKDFSDVQIFLTSLDNNNMVSETSQFYSHKIFLSRSEKLRRLLTNDLKGTDSLRLNEKISKDAFFDILKFLYTDRISETADTFGNFQSKYKNEIERSGYLSFNEIGKTLQNYLQHYINNSSLSDVRFRCEDGVIVFGHKAILGARSEPFRALFLGGFKESTQNEISLPIKSKVWLLIMQYVYTDTVEITPEESVELLMNASKYQVERLKNICEEFIESGVDIENVAWLYEIADLYNAQQLKKYCYYFLMNEFDAVSKTEAFRNLSLQTLDELNKLRKPQLESARRCLVQ